MIHLYTAELEARVLLSGVPTEQTAELLEPPSVHGSPVAVEIIVHDAKAHAELWVGRVSSHASAIVFRKLDFPKHVEDLVFHLLLVQRGVLA